MSRRCLLLDGPDQRRLVADPVALVEVQRRITRAHRGFSTLAECQQPHESHHYSSHVPTDKEIVKAINSDSVSSDDLVSRDAWARICRARGRNFAAVDEESWQALCARRGYLLHRRNPRGF
jgi:hypothetical protein